MGSGSPLVFAIQDGIVPVVDGPLSGTADGTDGVCDHHEVIVRQRRVGARERIVVFHVCR
jgi:hypothetical protein